MRALHHSITLDHATVVMRPVGSRGHYRVGICLVPGRGWNHPPARQKDQALRHTPCEECTRWVGGAPMCACCAQRTEVRGSSLTGAGRLPAPDDALARRQAEARPGRASAGPPPAARGEGPRPVAAKARDLTPREGPARAASPARRRSRTPLRAEEEGPSGSGERRRRVDGASRRTPPTRTEHGRAGAGAESREKEAQEEYEYYSEDEEEEEETCPDREEEDDRWESGRRPPPEPPLPQGGIGTGVPATSGDVDARPVEGIVYAAIHASGRMAGITPTTVI